MTRSRSKCAALLALLLSVACTLEPGNPWAQVDFSLQVAFDPSARLDDASGRLRVGDGYQVEIDALTLDLSAISLRLLADATNTDFDPSAPPPGYSLCHNGHCHADDGRLVDYEDIALELGAAAGVGASITQAIEGSISPTPAGVPVTLGECSQGCMSERGALGSLAISVATLRVSGRAFDTRESRLPPEGVAFSWSLPVERPFEVPLTGAVERGDAVDLSLDASLEVTDRLLDGIDWTQVSEQTPSAEFAGALTSQLLEESTLRVENTREP